MGLVVPHGTGSPLLDRYEARELHAAFGGPRGVPPVTAFKPYVGHTLGASALLETVLMLEAMARAVVPGILGCSEPDPAVNLPVVIATRPARVRVALKTVSAFAGFTAAALFTTPDDAEEM